MPERRRKYLRAGHVFDSQIQLKSQLPKGIITMKLSGNWSLRFSLCWFTWCTNCILPSNVAFSCSCSFFSGEILVPWFPTPKLCQPLAHRWQVFTSTSINLVNPAVTRPTCQPWTDGRLKKDPGPGWVVKAQPVFLSIQTPLWCDPKGFTCRCDIYVMVNHVLPSHEAQWGKSAPSCTHQMPSWQLHTVALWGGGLPLNCAPCPPDQSGTAGPPAVSTRKKTSVTNPVRRLASRLTPNMRVRFSKDLQLQF